MQAPRFLHNLLTSSLSVIHAKRLQTVLDTVGALLGERRLGLTAIGRALPSSTDAKHAIKRVDRLLGNPHLHQERPLFYWLMASLLIGHTTRPLILVDWSPIDDRGRHFLLRAAVPFAGRSLPIFEKVHHKEGCPYCEAYLLDALARILPDKATPILVTDAGFRNPWFRAVEARGWYIVGRVRQPARYQASGEAWQPVKTLFQHATSEPQAWGSVRIAENHPFRAQMVLYYRPPRGRKHRNKQGRISRDGGSRTIARRQQEPWVLVSNLPDRSTLANKVVTIYRQRMQIEEGFRDVKSPLFGLGFGMHQSRQGKRIEVLLLIAMLANVAMMVAGLDVRARGQQRRYQSNSIRHRSVLSVWRLGLECLRRHQPDAVPWPAWTTLRARLREEVREQSLCGE
ncbi:IS4 family transposase [Halomonas piscis]|uniref:IS4 family transposase n=2 Tax=Halomonas TaxID=2745 RepID=A0ABY9Z052_9GAMM|nr:MULTISPECIES: IS4 family transposase [Halomonas]WNK19033.1 IS4 family transposase [Halomonas piscis]WNK19079.1 IS4 family transposase [Halomonas piscis]WNK19476.1 IS4 family transposase [Halomonas piscis]WNK19584.1 IS4 family transposase [Halomonas piscis]WNK19780.1 IS4 family transposase [Halomonas piscis]